MRGYRVTALLWSLLTQQVLPAQVWPLLHDGDVPTLDGPIVGGGAGAGGASRRCWNMQRGDAPPPMSGRVPVVERLSHGTDLGQSSDLKLGCAARHMHFDHLERDGRLVNAVDQDLDAVAADPGDSDRREW